MPTLAAPKAVTETATRHLRRAQYVLGLALPFILIIANSCLVAVLPSLHAAAAPTAVAAAVSAFIAVVVVLLARSPPLSVGHFVLNMNMANDVTSHVMSRHMQKVPSSLPLFLCVCGVCACVCC